MWSNDLGTAEISFLIISKLTHFVKNLFYIFLKYDPFPVGEDSILPRGTIILSGMHPGKFAPSKAPSDEGALVHAAQFFVPFNEHGFSAGTLPGVVLRAANPKYQSLPGAMIQ